MDVPCRDETRLVCGCGQKVAHVCQKVQQLCVDEIRLGEPPCEEGEEDGVGEHLLEREGAGGGGEVLAHHGGELPDAGGQVAAQVTVEEGLLGCWHRGGAKRGVDVGGAHLPYLRVQLWRRTGVGERGGGLGGQEGKWVGRWAGRGRVRMRVGG
eukprot:scaffold4788_cov82-Isochrysis_galbana.AAC.2